MINQSIAGYRIIFIMRVLVLGALLWTASTAHVEVGKYDPILNRWSGYQPVCDQQCVIAGGELCGTTFRQCCSAGQCGTFYGRVELCQEVIGFKCNPDEWKEKLE